MPAPPSAENDQSQAPSELNDPVQILSLKNSDSRVYYPLNEVNDEIRVLSIERLHPGALVHCNLETVSLEQYTEDFASFFKSMKQEKKTMRRAMTEWVQLHPPHPDYPYGGFSQGINSVPSPNAYRFKWGDFAALSYVWGNSRELKQIVVNRTVMLVTKNLEVILRALAANNEFNSQFKIWIDAICIKQNDQNEKASQVGKMREIYSGAWVVTAWLGETREWTPIPDAFLFLRFLASLDDNEQDLGRLIEEKYSLINADYFYMLHEMMRNPYWKRLWIIQEVVMGASFTVLRSGDHFLDWDTFCAGIAVLYQENNWDFKDRMLEEMWRRGTSKHLRWKTTSIHLVHQDLRRLSRYEHEGGKRVGFRRLLEIANTSSCRYVRDKVFGLVGMMEPEIVNEVVRAYSLDIPRLFATITKAFITQHNNLEPLRQANPWGRHRAPSWAADWTWSGRLRWSRIETNSTGPLWNSLDPDLNPESIYNAHGGRRASFAFLNENRLLRCRGFVFEEVGGLGAREYGIFDWIHESIVPYPGWRSAYGDEHPTAQALYRALVGGKTSKGETAVDHHLAIRNLPSTFLAAGPQFQKRGWTWLANRGGYYFKWENWRQVHNDFMLGERALGSHFTDAIPEDANETTFMDVFRGVERMVMERRFMLTKNGRFGWAPDDATDSRAENQVRVGDLIAIIFGCSTPLVIRHQGEHYQVVGEAYVEGMMEGAALRLLEDRECKEQFFTFC